MSEINVNTPTMDVPTSEPITKTGGESSVSFDDLERVIDTKSQKTEKSQSKKEGKENGKSEEKAKTKEKEEVTDKKVAKDKAESSDKTKEQAAAARLYKARYLDKDIELGADSMFEHKVNGQKVSVKLEDLLANYSGKTDWDRKYSALDQERKTFYTERDGMNGALNKVYEMTVKENNPRGAIEFLAELMGADPLKVWNDFKSQAQGSLDELMKLTPEERAKKAADDELEYYRKRDQARTQEKQHQQIREGIKSRVDKVQQDGNIDDATFYKLYQEIANSGKVPANEITPELVGRYHKQVHMQDNVTKAIEQAGINTNEQPKAYEELLDIWETNPSFKLEDVVEIAKEVYGNKSVKNLSKKVSKTEPEDTVKPSRTRRNDPITFDDLYET